MLARLTALWEPRRDRYAAVAYLRHDVEFRDDLDVVQLLTMRDGELAVPFSQTAPGHPSDVFAFGTPDAAAVFGSRLRHARAYASQRYLNSHAFLGAVLKDAAVAVRPTGMRLKRVRATGHRAWLDSCADAPWCVLANDDRDCAAFSCVAGRRTYQAGDMTAGHWLAIDYQLDKGPTRVRDEPFDLAAPACCREPGR